ncbi:hypothetical protein GCM10010329_79000 [Streptomyces spiroverticillatus]|uniref:Uncharacterized protein n=1 Tax=Streptomyces finlayi TaxID=67296 RepID=A0A918X850_9ACTN|nr:hypothetical protein [Streptomyces finlayi]GHA44526.1 hypothetical protein GCM10010329_79000 [Streptomyces spiroverticillatus]GHD17829.1 hypothetical protein GCM10010334_79980 [Streptomyces finlayi]
MDTNAEPELAQHTTNAAGPPIRQLFRDVIADRIQGPRPPQAAILFDDEVDPCWDDRSFLGDFYSEILHQDTCQPATADGLALVAALAVDDRVLAQHRFQAVDLLFRAATVAERHLAETWPTTPQHADPDSEARARNAVQAHVPTLLARWTAECTAVRLALAGLAVVFPTDRTLPALTPRLQNFLHQHPQGTDIGDYLRFVVVLATQNDDRILTATEQLTDAHWTGTARGVPTRPRAPHLLGQMLTKVGIGLTRAPPRQ